MIIVIGLDGATWKVITPNISRLPVLRELCATGNVSTIHVEGTVKSPAIWCSMFSGVPSSEHGHSEFYNKELSRTYRRDDLDVEFIWEMPHLRNEIVVINVPVIIPTISVNTVFIPVAGGLPLDPSEWDEEIGRVTGALIAGIQARPEILIGVYTVLDRVQHFHWGTPEVIKWYEKIDSKLGCVIPLLDNDDQLVIVSDHGFCSWEEAGEHTLNEEGYKSGTIKGDHHPEAILITRNVDYPIIRTEDVYRFLRDREHHNPNY